MSTLTEAPVVTSDTRTYAEWRQIADELSVAITETSDRATLDELHAARLDALAASDRAWISERAR